jgi:adenylate cyclase
MNPLIRKLLIALVVSLVSIIITQEEILKLGLVERLELASVDYRFQSRAKRVTVSDSSNVIIVEVNDESFKSLPDRWPWPRSYYAHLIRNLKAAGAKAIGVDIILNEADPYSPKNDEDLRRAIRETGITVLAGKLESQHRNYELVSANENFGNIFFSVDSSLGLVNVRNDADGVYRRYSPFWEATHIQNRDTLRIPTFSFAVLNKFFDCVPSLVASNDPGSFGYAGRTIPKYDPSSLLINFRGPSGTFRRVKFADVIDDESITTTDEAATGEQINTFSDTLYGYKHDGTFRGKIVLVGSTTPEDHDLFPVSVAHGPQQGNNLMYGVEIHANVIESVLQSDFLHRQSKASELLVIFLISFVTFFATSAFRAGRSRKHFALELYAFLFVIFEIAAIAASALWLFTENRFVIAVISPMVAVLGGYVASTTYNFVAERRQRLLIKSMFSTYVHPTVVDELIAHPEKLQLGGERKQLSVLFSDIEGFTTISEHMPSEELVALLNEYFSMMSGIILRNNGTLDKFFGDAVIAFWGAPLPQEDHALRACIAALEMQRTLSEIRERWRMEGKPILYTRIGINTGDMVVGNMGGAEKFDYTVIGDSVNIASRLEGANKVYRTNIMVSETTYELVKHKILARELDLISVKGRSEPFRTYELLQMQNDALDPTLERFLEHYAGGLRLYRSRKWEEAEKEFRQVLAIRNSDYPSKLHIERAAHFKLSPPPDDWNGVFELTTK